MVPIERHERRKLHPTVAQLFVRVIVETTRISTDEWDLEDLELEHALNVEVHVLPLAEVVAEPVTCPLARTREGAARNKERTLAGVDRLQSDVSGLFFHYAPQVVGIELDVATSVCRVGCKSVDGQATVAYGRE